MRNGTRKSGRRASAVADAPAARDGRRSGRGATIVALPYPPVCAMPLDVIVVMDPIDHIKIAKDTTFAMLLEAQRRGHRRACWR